MADLLSSSFCIFSSFFLLFSFASPSEAEGNHQRAKTEKETLFFIVHPWVQSMTEGFKSWNEMMNDSSRWMDDDDRRHWIMNAHIYKGSRGMEKKKTRFFPILHAIQLPFFLIIRDSHPSVQQQPIEFFFFWVRLLASSGCMRNAMPSIDGIGSTKREEEREEELGDRYVYIFISLMLISSFFLSFFLPSFLFARFGL